VPQAVKLIWINRIFACTAFERLDGHEPSKTRKRNPVDASLQGRSISWAGHIASDYRRVVEARSIAQVEYRAAPGSKMRWVCRQCCDANERDLVARNPQMATDCRHGAIKDAA